MFSPMTDGTHGVTTDDRWTGRGIPLVDLRAQYKTIKREIDRAVSEVLESCEFIGGAAVAAFEAQFAEMCGGVAASGVGNGTDALELALRALGIGPGDEVITAVNTFIATSEAITQTGARVRFVDVDARTLTIDVVKIEEAVNPRTRAVIPVHLYGHPAPMDPLLELAQGRGLAVIEDAAQAHGARYRGRPVGSLGTCAAFSFYPGKNLGAYGDAGAVVSQSKEIIDRVRRVANHGRLEKYLHEIEGVNSRLDAIQAAVLSVKLAHLQAWNMARRRAAARYNEFLRPLPITLPIEEPGVESVYHLYVVRLPERDRVRRRLAEKGIQTGIHYPVPLHLQPAYRHLGLGQGAFPVAEKAAAQILSLPMYPELTVDQQLAVAEALAEALDTSGP